MVGRLGIDDESPVVGHGGYPAKAAVGEHLVISATVWREGHGAVGAAVEWREPDGRTSTVPMQRQEPGGDRWHAVVVPRSPGESSFRVLAWADPWTTWRSGLQAKLGAGLTDLSNELEEGARLLERVRPPGQEARGVLDRAVAALRDAARPLPQRVGPALSEPVHRLVTADPPRDLLTEGTIRPVAVDRHRALFGSWYEFFPRSTGGTAADGTPLHGTLRTAARELPRIARMGFDVVYLPPVHPIGRVHRKGPNNTLTAGPDDVGSPWAVGAREGGHDAVHPLLGTVEDFTRFTATARSLGLEVALDLALQCAPDHPWVTEHPEWFTARPDGTIAFAENPPKKYEDIYPLDFDTAPGTLYAEVLRIVRLWIDRGVRIFRVDNPHTKPPDFWEWLIRTVRGTHPDVFFLAEAFTRPAVLKGLARRGFAQSYTYFTWRTTKQELTSYLTELAADADFLRPNLFVNTPDILPVALQRGGPGMFALRAALAATLSPSWGVYSGYELYEDRALRPGSEEYLDSEKYQLRPRDFDGALARGRSLEPWLTLLNRIRRDHPALQQLRTLRFHPVDNDALIAYSKTDPATGDAVLCVVSLNPSDTEEGTVALDLDRLGRPRTPFTAVDEVTGEVAELGPVVPVKLDPERAAARIFAWRTS
ncbi:alpha-1,4-glucan--maltose-1-phosphate maltosyltransferase [Streptomyces sp. NPDC052309]|uniref:alpha-1,4-glucan--maltose-1-phosphate maltosyltransferase n=1 Tax=Streptomyces sp. NPDC052309 TaxID=3155421 RepID=UPI003418684E